MESGYVEATNQNLPMVDSSMVFDYFKTNPDFQDPEVRNVKTTKAARDNYGDNAVGYVQVKRLNDVCMVKARVTPEHKVRQAGYQVVTEVDEKENIIMKCECLDCSASAGGCKHSLAFLLWLHRRSEEPSVTSVECYWIKPKLSKVGTSIKFATLQDLCKKEIPPLPTVGDDFLQKVLAEGKLLGSQGTLFQSVADSDNIANVCLHRLHCSYKREGGSDVDGFLHYISNHVDGTCAGIQKETAKQYKSSKWYTVRYGRITASKLHEASRCNVFDGELVRNILGGSRPIQTAAIERGRKLEEHVKEAFEQSYGFKVKDAGFFIDKKYPVFGASPDGLTATHVIEIKCPTRTETVKNYIANGNVKEKPYAQMQLQMLLAKKKKGFFIVAAPDFEKTKNFQVLEVTLDESFLTQTMTRAEEFWKRAIFPKL